MKKLTPRVRSCRYLFIPTSDQTRGHGTHSFPALWQNYLRELLVRIQPASP